MIRRGTPISRALALLVAFSPVLLVVGLFVFWAMGRWEESGADLAAAEQRRHEAIARGTQARLYAPLGEAWAEYAQTEVSGLAQEESDEEAAAAVRARIAALFEEAKGDLIVVERLADAAPSRPGLRQLRFEVRGSAPEQAAPALLASLEAEPPFLFVEFLDLERAEGAERRLEIRLRASLYRMTGEGA